MFSDPSTVRRAIVQVIGRVMLFVALPLLLLLPFGVAPDWDASPLAGIVMIALGVPQYFGWATPGSTFGLHPSVMEGLDSPEEWYQIHRTFGRSLIAVGVYFLFLAELVAIVPLLPERAGWTGWIVALAAPSMLAVPVTRTQRRLLQKRKLNGLT